MAVEWEYDPETHRYYADGRLVPWRTIIRTRDQFAAARQSMLRALGEQLAAGTITLAVWETEFRRIVAETIAALHLFGAGGEQMIRQKPIHLVRLMEALQRQIPYARGFVDEVYLGRVSLDAVAARSELYVGAGITAYEQARADDWGITLPYYPADHGTPCHSNCRCNWEISTSIDEDTGRDVTTAWWRTEHDDRVCSGCMARGAEYPAPGVVVA